MRHQQRQEQSTHLVSASTNASPEIQRKHVVPSPIQRVAAVSPQHESHASPRSVVARSPSPPTTPPREARSPSVDDVILDIGGDKRKQLSPTTMSPLSPLSPLSHSRSRSWSSPPTSPLAYSDRPPAPPEITSAAEDEEIGDNDDEWPPSGGPMPAPPAPPQPSQSNPLPRRPSRRPALRSRSVSCRLTPSSPPTCSPSRTGTGRGTGTAAASPSPPHQGGGSDSEVELERLRRLLRKAREDNGMADDHPRIALLHNRIGNVHFQRHEFELARGSYCEALRLYRSRLGTGNDDHPVVSLCLINIGTVHWRLGEHDLALAFMEEALILRQHALGEDHLDVADALHNMGQVHLLRGADGDDAEAASVLGRALSIRRRHLGAGHVEVARTLRLVGCAHLRRGDADRALVAHEEALRLKRALLGNQHPSVVVSILDVAHVLRRGGDLRRAVGLFRDALATQRFLCRASGVPEDCVDVGVTLQMIGNVCMEMGDAVEGKRAYGEARRMYGSAGLGEDHPFVIALGNAVEDMGL